MQGNFLPLLDLVQLQLTPVSQERTRQPLLQLSLLAHQILIMTAKMGLQRHQRSRLEQAARLTRTKQLPEVLNLGNLQHLTNKVLR